MHILSYKIEKFVNSVSIINTKLIENMMQIKYTTHEICLQLLILACTPTFYGGHTMKVKMSYFHCIQRKSV